jgi:hypothetical protein
MPTEAAFRLAEAVGLFAPLSALIDRDAAATANDAPSEPGRISSRSLPSIWRWLSEEVEPDIAGGIIEMFARAAVGSPASGESPLDALPKLRVELGRAAMGVLEQQPPGELADLLGSRRAAHDARLVAQAFAICQDIEKLRALSFVEKGAPPPAAVELARDVAVREPECAAALACVAVALVQRTADAAPILFALAKRREEFRLDKSALAPALAAAVEAACTRGAAQLSVGASPDAALVAVRERARDVADLSAALRGHVSEDWPRRWNHRLGELGRTLDELCADYAGTVRNVLSCPDLGLEAEAAATAAAAAKFLNDAESVASILRFETARRQAVSQVQRELEGPAVDAAEERLRGLAQRSISQAERYVELRAQVIELFQDKLAARAWSRRGRRIIGRPTFAEYVLAAIEPVLVDDDGSTLRDGQIARELIEELWDWSGANGLQEARAEAADGFAAEREQDPAAAFEYVVRHRRALAQAAREAAETTSSFAPETRGNFRPQLSVIAALLAAESKIRNRLDVWPPKIKHVMEEHVAGVRELHDALTATWSEIEPALLVLVMARLERPWHVLRILERIARANSDTLVEATEFVAIGEILIDRAEVDARCFRVAHGEPINADRIITALERFAGVASGMTEEFQIRRNGVWGSRLYTLKARAARDLEALCGSAVELVDAITPRVSHSGGKWSADASHTVDDVRIMAAAQLCRFLRCSKVLDHRAAFAGARSKAMTRIEGRLTSQVEALLTLAHAGEVRDQALAQLRALASVVAEFEGREAGDILLRRAAAA